MDDSHRDDLVATANRLYWHTARSASELADEMGISRSKLYTLIEPLRLDRRCSTCDGPLVFENRTERDAGHGRCLECDAVTDLPPEATAVRDPRPAGPPLRAREPAESSAPVVPSSWFSAPEYRAIWIGAGLGLAAGLMAGTWYRRR